MLDVKNLSVSYGLHRALENASLHVGKGEIVVILGANGAGKSSLLKAIAGISEGRVTGTAVLDGEDLIGARPDRVVEAGFALVPEGRGIFADLSVLENLTLGAYAVRARDDEAENLDRVFSLFPKLHERRRQTVRTMSGGEQQMVAIGRAMMSNPTVLGLDEPSLGLSPLLCKNLFQSLVAVRDTGLGVLLVEQNAKQSLRIADRGYLLENGEIVNEDTGEALARDPAVQKAYLGGAAAPRAPVAKVAPLHRPKPAPAPRPSAPSPREIAATALKDVAALKSVGSAVQAPPLPASAPVKPSVSKVEDSQVQPKNGMPTAAKPDIRSLVERASAKASRRANGATPLQNRRSAETASTHFRPDSPDLSQPSADRLRSIIDDIEAAAKRAESYRPPGRRS